MCCCTVVPGRISRPSRASRSAGRCARAVVAICAATAWNTSVLATKSVSQFSSSSTPAWVPSSSAVTRPFAAVRPARLPTSLAPLRRRISTAASKSPSASSSAFLQSSMPAAVCSRSRFTSAAVKFAMSSSIFRCVFVVGLCRAGAPAGRPEPDVRPRRPGWPAHPPGRPRHPPSPAGCPRGWPRRLASADPFASAAASAVRHLGGGSADPFASALASADPFTSAAASGAARRPRRPPCPPGPPAPTRRAAPRRRYRRPGWRAWPRRRRHRPGRSGRPRPRRRSPW